MAREFKKYVMKDSNDYRPNNNSHEVLLINSVNGQDIAFGRFTIIDEDMLDLTEEELERMKEFSRPIPNISLRQCRELLKVQDPEKQYKLALGVIEYGDKYDELERKINNDKNLPKKDKEKSLKYQAIYRDIENSFQGFFGTKVKLEAGKRKGKIVIEYNSNDDLERILGLIK